MKLTWFGRCCFLIEINNHKILIDPHDSFDGVEIGIIDADYTLISSTWHDHGHIGASPKSIVLSEPGKTSIDNLTIIGIETKETRGTRNIIFNIQSEGFSLTNFADLGDPESLKCLSKADLDVLNSTNIAFVRPNQILHEQDITSCELALRVCNPKIIIPHHFYPANFIEKENCPKEMLDYLPELHKLLAKLSYKLFPVKGYQVEITSLDLSSNSAMIFSKIHPQVKFKK